MIPLLYANNADIKYPLSDFHTADIPNDALLDLSISVPPGIVPVLTGLRVGRSLAFLVLEDQVTNAPVAWVAVAEPTSARIYPLTMDVDGYGWVVFGPRVASDVQYYYHGAAVELDPECVLPLKVTAPLFRLEINGYLFEVDNLLRLSSLSELLLVTRDGNTIYFDRNDAILSADELAALQEQPDKGAQGQYVFTIGGTKPDALGNIDIVVTGLIAGCLPVNDLTIARGDMGAGVSGELPLDLFKPRVYGPDDPCGPSQASSSGSSSAVPDPFEGAYEVKPIPLIDPATSKPIGSLYTVR